MASAGRLILLLALVALARSQTTTPAASATADPNRPGVTLESDTTNGLRADLDALANDFVKLHEGWYFGGYVSLVKAELNDPENPIAAEDITPYSAYFGNDAEMVSTANMYNEITSDKASALQEALQTIVLGNGEDILPAAKQDVQVTLDARKKAYDARMLSIEAEYNAWASRTDTAFNGEAAETMQLEDWLPLNGRGRQIALATSMAQITMMETYLRPAEGDPAPPDPLDKLPDPEDVARANKANGDGQPKEEEKVKPWMVLAIGGGVAVVLIAVIGLVIVKVMNARAADRPMQHHELREVGARA